MRRLLTAVVSLVAVALVQRLVQSAAIPLPDSASVGGAVALVIGGVVVLVFFLPSAIVVSICRGSWFAPLALAGLAGVLVLVSTLLGGGAAMLAQRIACPPAWPPFSVTLDVLGLFSMPSALTTLALVAVSWKSSTDWHANESAIDLATPLVRVVGFGLLIPVAGLFLLYAEDFAARWPHLVSCGI